MKKIQFDELNMTDAATLMLEWKAGNDSKIDPKYEDIRNKLISTLDNVNTEKMYAFDFEFGIKLYTILAEHGFTIRDASNDNVWRYLSLCVIPDIVEKRWNRADIRFYKQSNRIWLKTIWWYVYLGLQINTQNGVIDMEKTLTILRDNSTDQILQMVDRSGKKGYYQNVCRRIMLSFYIAKQNDSSVGNSDFRKIMILHTAISTSINPELYPNGVEGYVNMLFNRIGIELKGKHHEQTD